MNGSRRPIAPAATTRALALLGLLSACGPSLDGDVEDLRRVLADERRAHLESDAARLVSHMADTLVSVDGGLVTRAPRTEVERGFAAYFEGATYHAWDDVETPRIRVSEDGHMAWVVRRVTVDREEADPAAPRTRFESAWTATYEKRAGAWRMTSVTSTFAPPDEAGRVLAAARRASRPGEDAAGDTAGVAFEAIRARADVSGPRDRFTVTVISAGEGRVRIEFSPGMTAALGGDRDWIRGSADSAASEPTPAMRAFVHGHEVHWNLLRPQTRYGPLRFTGATRFAGRPALRLTGTDAAGGAIDLFYAETDSLPLGYEVSDHLGGPTDRVRLVVEEWTARPGARFPAVASFLQGDDRFRYRFVDVEVLEMVPDSLFDAPAGSPSGGS